jgi:ElaB/YqjD/DUF883 family membrane-anchored ribosome-binding protein
MADTPMEDELRMLKEDLAVLRADVADLSGTLRDYAASRGEGIRSNLQHEVRMRRERLKERMADARVQGAKTVEEMEESIGQHPIASVATALGVGFVLAKLMDVGSRR